MVQVIILKSFSRHSLSPVLLGTWVTMGYIHGSPWVIMGHHDLSLSLSKCHQFSSPHLGLLEDIADTRSSDTDKELNEFGGRGLDERHSSLTWGTG